MLKRYSLGTLAVLAMVFMIVACGGGGGEEAPAAAPKKAEGAPSAGDGGSIAGTVTYANGDPDMEIKMDADPVCSGLHAEAVHTDTVAVNDSGQLANVFVYVKEGASGGGAPADPHVLNQEGCLYLPHVSGIQVGQKLIIRNSDPTLHNVHAMPAVNPEFNQGQPFQGMELEKSFDQVEVMVPFKCDVHPWMSSYMAVLDHGFFAVSGADGGFSIGDLPAGDYVVEAWHETLGTQTQSVTVGDGKAELNFDFQPAT